MKPTILSCAVVGAFTMREHHPQVPITPEEIATACIEAAQAGAAIVHIHVRDPETGLNSTDLGLYREVVDRIRTSETEVLINLTTGPGARFTPSIADPMIPDPSSRIVKAVERTEHVAALRPDICSLDLNTMWFGTGSVVNVPDIIREMTGIIRESGVKPELEVFDSGDIRLAQDLLDEGLLEAPPFFQIVLGIKYGFAGNPETLFYARSQLPKGSEWAAFGISRMAFPLLAQSWLAGGHCRIGLEDAIYLSKGVLAPSNAAMVSKAVRIIEDLGGRVATVDEAREILKLRSRVSQQ
ncbi:3-keto-5-aminohexanoate cleavage protein [Chloroflexi bacterium TSY]|nr:3-keto-5-aminohexanoate cleavage protein [Chloroflexi bacterium TSY]